MIYRVRATLRNPTRQVTVLWAGCQDEEDCRQKVAKHYREELDVIDWVEPNAPKEPRSNRPPQARPLF